MGPYAQVDSIALLAHCSAMERSQFLRLSAEVLEYLDEKLGGLEHDDLDVDLGGDVLTLAFADGGKFIINAHSAAGQVWMAAGTEAWHFDYDEASKTWIAGRTGDELLATVERTVGPRIGVDVKLRSA